MQKRQKTETKCTQTLSRTNAETQDPVCRCLDCNHHRLVCHDQPAVLPHHSRHCTPTANRKKLSNNPTQTYLMGRFFSVASELAGFPFGSFCTCSGQPRYGDGAGNATEETLASSPNLNALFAVSRGGMQAVKFCSRLVSWSLTSLFSTNMAISETKGQGWKVIRTQ